MSQQLKSYVGCAYTQWLMQRGCTSVAQVCKLQASALQPPAIFFSFKESSWAEVEDRSSLFLLRINMCFCFIIFFLLFIPNEVHFSVYVWKHADRPCIPGKLSNSYRFLGLGPSAQKAILCCHPTPGSAIRFLQGALKNAISRPTHGNSE